MYEYQHHNVVKGLLNSYNRTKEEIRLEKFREELLKLDKDKLLLAKHNITVEGLHSITKENCMLDHQVLMYMYIEEFKEVSDIVPIEYTMNDSLGLTICLANIRDIKGSKNFILFPIYLSYQHYAVFIYSKDKNVLEYFDSLISKNFEDKFDIINDALVKSGITKKEPLLHFHRDTELQNSGSNECGYYSFYFTKCKVGKLQNRINVEEIKGEFIKMITKDIFVLTEQGDISKLPEFWQFDSSEMSSCLEDFINFENIELDFPESEDIEASIFNLSEITEKKIFSEKLDKQKKRIRGKD